MGIIFISPFIGTVRVSGMALTNSANIGENKNISFSLGLCFVYMTQLDDSLELVLTLHSSWVHYFFQYNLRPYCHVPRPEHSTKLFATLYTVLAMLLPVNVSLH